MVINVYSHECDKIQTKIKLGQFLECHLLRWKDRGKMNIYHSFIVHPLMVENLVVSKIL
jgi:hypothetical protein